VSVGSQTTDGCAAMPWPMAESATAIALRGVLCRSISYDPLAGRGDHQCMICRAQELAVSMRPDSLMRTDRQLTVAAFRLGSPADKKTLASMGYRASVVPTISPPQMCSAPGPCTLFRAGIEHPSVARRAPSRRPRSALSPLAGQAIGVRWRVASTQRVISGPRYHAPRLTISITTPPSDGR
jgi:hypothetical protein